MSSAAAMALTAVSRARTLIALAQAMGWIRTSADRSLERIDERLRGLLEAPVHEGLDRIVLAVEVENPRRRRELLREARYKLHDAAAHPAMPSDVVAIACVTCASLALIQNDAVEARIWVKRALDAYDACLLKAHRDASGEALVYVGAEVPRSPQEWPKGPWSRLTRGARILRACMRESTESVQALADKLGSLNEEVAEAHTFAAQLGVTLDGRCREVTMRHFKAVVVLVKLRRVEPAHSGE